MNDSHEVNQKSNETQHEIKLNDNSCVYKLSPSVQITKTPNQKIIQPRNKNRRTFTPNALNRILPSPEISPIENVNRSVKTGDKIRVKKIKTSLTKSYDLTDSSQSVFDQQFRDMKNSSLSLMFPPEKTVVHRTFNTVLYPKKGRHVGDVKMNKAFTNTSTPIINIEKNNLSTCEGSEDLESYPIDSSSENKSNNSTESSKLNFSNFEESFLFSKSSSFNLTDLQLTPKSPLNKCISISSILVDLGLEKYISNFQTKNISINSFMSFNNSDLIRYGVKNDSDRQTILKLINFQMETSC